LGGGDGLRGEKLLVGDEAFEALTLRGGIFFDGGRGAMAGEAFHGVGG